MPVYPYSLKDGTKRYYVSYRDPAHKQRVKRGFARKRDAELYEASVRVDASRGQYIDPKRARTKVSELYEVYLARQSVSVKASTLRPIEIGWKLRVKPRWGDFPVNQISHDEIQKWVSELATHKSPTVVRRDYGTLSAILDIALRSNRIPNNPAKDVRLPKATRGRNTYLTHTQLQRLASNSGSHESLVLLLGYCGLRWGEATALEVRDLNFAAKRIRVCRNAVWVGKELHVGTTKNGEDRTVPLPDFLAKRLSDECEHKAENDLLFPGLNGKHMHQTRVNVTSGGWFAQALDKTGLPRTIHPHDLRHTAASIAISSGANVKAVQRMLGHKSAVMTLDRYAELFDDDLDDLTEAIDKAATEAKLTLTQNRA